MRVEERRNCGDGTEFPGAGNSNREVRNKVLMDVQQMGQGAEPGPEQPGIRSRPSKASHLVRSPAPHLNSVPVTKPQLDKTRVCLPGRDLGVRVLTKETRSTFLPSHWCQPGLPSAQQEASSAYKQCQAPAKPTTWRAPSHQL